MKVIHTYLIGLFWITGLSIFASTKIDRYSLITRNNPHITSIDTLGSLSVGNGEFAFTCDITGLQTFPATYSKGVPLGTMAQWGWHYFPNPQGFKAEDALRPFDFGRNREEWYSCQLKTGREKEASNWLRANPHRVHLGTVGFANMEQSNIHDIDQTLNMWTGILRSNFSYGKDKIEVQTSCDANMDMVVARISDPARHAVVVRFPYPTGAHSDDACDWNQNDKHQVEIMAKAKRHIIAKHTMDGQDYFVKIYWNNAKQPYIDGTSLIIKPTSRKWSVAVEFCKDIPEDNDVDMLKSVTGTTQYWTNYWEQGAAVDFSNCSDPRAKELERRVVLSQYLLAIQCAGSTPPQETGLTYNSWFGKFHLEMIWWHMAHFALWNHPEMLERTLPWYHDALLMAREIANRQGFNGARWMKMTDPTAAEAPSNVGSFLIWQQPHIIYLAELLYRSTRNEKTIQDYAELVEETATFMADFASYDSENDRYVLKGAIPAQETLKAAETINPPFELSYWYYALSVAQDWRIRRGIARNPKWDDIINKLSTLCAKDNVYAAAETADSYNSPTQKAPLALYSDHMAVLGAVGILPQSPLVDNKLMTNTLDWVLNNWNWDKTWGWDYPTTCMNAVRLGHPDKAIDILLSDKRTNTYLVNGHNYQDGRLRCYLPGNGGLLTAIALMCAGWDGCEDEYPGFPKNGKWNVKSEGLLPMP